MSNDPKHEPEPRIGSSSRLTLRAAREVVIAQQKLAQARWWAKWWADDEVQANYRDNQIRLARDLVAELEAELEELQKKAP